MLLEDRLEIAIEPRELEREVPLRHGVPPGDPLRRLLTQMAQEQPEQVRGLARRDGCRGPCDGRIGGLDPARLQLLEHTGHIATRPGAGRQVEHIALDDRFLDSGPGAQHHARHEPPHGMHGDARPPRLCGAIPHGDRQLDALRIAGASGRDQTQ